MRHIFQLLKPSSNINYFSNNGATLLAVFALLIYVGVTGCGTTSKSGKTTGKRTSKVEADVVKDSFIIHTVTKTETLYGLMQQYNIGADELRQYNKGLGNSLKTGEKIKIPLPEKLAKKEQAKSTENAADELETAKNITTRLTRFQASAKSRVPRDRSPGERPSPRKT